MLLLLNGPPAVGKSALARRWTGDHPLALCLDIDAIRTSLGRWADHEESKSLARALAVAMARSHLAAGYDVVVPQLLVKPDFVAVLADVAAGTGRPFVEALLLDERDALIARVRARRRALAASGEQHPQAFQDPAADEALIDDTLRRLAGLPGQRPATKVVSLAGASLDDAYALLCRAIPRRP